MMNILNKYNIGKKKLIGIGIFIILFLIALPLTLIQVQKQQELRQRAGGNSLHLEMFPPQQIIKKEESFNTFIILQNPIGDVSAVDVVITYSNDVLVLDSFEPISDVSGFTTIVDDIRVPGEIHYVGVNSNLTPSKGSGFIFGRLSFKGKGRGVGTVGFSSVVVTARGELHPLSINPTDNKQGTYIIEELTPTPTPSSITPTPILPTPTPDLTSTPVPQAYYLEQSESTIYMPVSQPTTGHGIYVLLRESGTNNIVVNQEDFAYFWSLDNYGLASIVPNAGCIFGIHPPCPEGNLFIQGLKPGSGNIYVKVIQISTGLSVATATFSLNVLPPDLTPIPSFVPTPTPTPGPLPYSYNIFPKEGPQGTIFTVTVKTRAQLADGFYLNVQFYLPSENFSPGLVRSSNQNQYVDGFYNYFFPFDSSRHKPQNVEVSFFSFGGKEDKRYTDKDSFAILPGNRDTSTCIPITNNGDNSKKIDIVVTSNNYKQDELGDFKNKTLPRHINAIFSKDPFSLNKDKFNVWFINQVNSQSCSLRNSYECSTQFISSTYKSCPFFDTIIVIDRNYSRSFADSYGIDKVAYNFGDDPTVTIHEFGHSFGGLADEYDMSNDPDVGTRYSNTSAANCDIFACPKWCSGESNFQKPGCANILKKDQCLNTAYGGVTCRWLSNNICDYPYDYKTPTDFGQSCQVGAGCYYGCGGIGGYRSTKNSIMNNFWFLDDIANSEFNAVSKKQIQKQIDSYIK